MQLDEFNSLVQLEDPQKLYSKDVTENEYFGMPLSPIVETEKRLSLENDRGIAYFSMEYGLASSFYNKFKTNRNIDEKNKVFEHDILSNYRLADYFFGLKSDRLMDLPIYSGGLGVLAGDTLKTMADYKLPAVAIGMLWSTGYFKQKFWFKYGQTPEAMQWDMLSYPGLVPLKNKVTISLNSHELCLRLWKYYAYSYEHDYAVPLILLDSNLEENNESDRHLTEQLYRSESVESQIMQRVILGMGGMAAINELGYKIDKFHLNEGHAVFAFVHKARGLDRSGIEDLRKHFAYTCHTPVAAGHDRYPLSALRKILTIEDCALLENLGKEEGDTINLTLVSMNAAGAINAVSKKHQEVMRMQFPSYKEKIQCVTNGVHHHTWISDSFKKLFEKYPSAFKDFRSNPMSLGKAVSLRKDEQFRADLWKAHQENKSALCGFFEKWKLNKDVFTVCWARRIAAYKRPSMILQDTLALEEIARNVGPLQIIIAGKAHPKDNLGFTYINQMLDEIDRLEGKYDFLKIIMLENYDIFFAKMLVSSVDVWLNNPLPPFEASGTSGMKAILNGVLQLSTLDGWVVEAEKDAIGRIFGYRPESGKIGNEQDLHMSEDSKELYCSIEEMSRLYYATNKGDSVDISSAWIDMMINCIRAAARFNTYRMMDEYKEEVWEYGRVKQVA